MKRFLFMLSGLLMVAGLSACGGGGSGGGNNNAPSSVSGVAATGAPIAYKKIYLRDSSTLFKNMSSLTSSSGEYSFSVTGMTPPFFLKTTDSNGKDLYSVGTGSGTVNVNPLTSLAVANAAGTGDPRKVFMNISSLGIPAKFTPTMVKNATDNIQNMIKPLTEGYNLTTFNPISGSFSANSIDPFDCLLDNIKVNFNTSTGSVSIDVKSGSAGTWTPNAIPPMMISAPTILPSAGTNIPISVDFIRSFPLPNIPMVVASGGKFSFIALVSKLGESLTWSVKEAGGGTIVKTSSGFGEYTAEYTAPAVTASSQYTIVATHSNGSKAETVITVTPTSTGSGTGGGTPGSGATAFIGIWNPSGGMDPASYQFTDTTVQAILPTGSAAPLNVTYSGNTATAVFTPPSVQPGMPMPPMASATWVFTIAGDGTLSITVNGMPKPGIYVKQP
ncbi:MAG: hypothetical protein A2076_18950 [Geobacteraceae bacterium GWC2_53_11]|nr:MAG: hypothetical protein A2076_18950 [Geobacteraceae bacterium GWC2_53_11]